MITIDDSGWGCERIDAEILTNNGWKTYEHLDKLDNVLSYNDNGCIEFIPYSRKRKRTVTNENLIRLYNQSSDIVVTDSHHFKVLKRITKGNAVTHTAKVIGYKPAYVHINNLCSNDRIPRTGKWIGRDKPMFVLPKIKRVKYDCNIYKNVAINMNDWVAFIGIWLAEGCCTQANKGGFIVVISQNKGIKYDNIKALLMRLPFNFREIDDGFITHDKQLWSYLSKFGDCYSKYIPTSILALSVDKLKILFDWMIMGDGNRCFTHNGKSEHIDYYTVSKRLRDTFQELVVKLGMSFTTCSRKRNSIIRGRVIKSTTPCYEISARNGQYISVGNLKKETIRYSGEVFDLEVPNGNNFFVRRNGIGYFTGNSLLGGVMIGMHSTVSGRFACKLIPVSAFKERTFMSRKYRSLAVKAFMSMLPKVGQDSQIQICRGTILDGIYDYLIDSKIFKSVIRVEIGEPLQSWLEDKFAQSLVKIGVHRTTSGAHCMSWDDTLAWVRENKSRIAYVKTGWGSWQAKYKNGKNLA